MADSEVASSGGARGAEARFRITSQDYGSFRGVPRERVRGTRKNRDYYDVAGPPKSQSHYLESHPSSNCSF